MKSRRILSKSAGFTLIETLIAVAIMLAVALGIMQLLGHQQREVRSMSEKLFANDIKIEMQTLILNQSYCNCLLRGRTFNTTSPTNPWTPAITNIPQGFVTPIPPPPATCVPRPQRTVPPVGSKFEGSHITIAALQMGSFVHHGGGAYTAEIEVQLDPTSLVRPLQNIRAPIAFQVDLTSGSPTNRPFTGCTSGNPDVRVFYEPAPVNSGTVVNAGTLVCSKSVATIQYGSKFLDDGDDSMGRLELIVNGAVVSNRLGGARSAGGGDITNAPSTIHGLWSGPCTGTINVRTNWVHTRQAPSVDESYIHVQFMD